MCGHSFFIFILQQDISNEVECMQSVVCHKLAFYDDD